MFVTIQNHLINLNNVSAICSTCIAQSNEVVVYFKGSKDSARFRINDNFLEIPWVSLLLEENFIGPFKVVYATVSGECIIDPSQITFIHSRGDSSFELDFGSGETLPVHDVHLDEVKRKIGTL